MLLKNNCYFRNRDFNYDIRKYADEFEETIININLKKCVVLAIVLIAVNIVLILVDLFVYKSLRFKLSAYLYLYYSHLFVVIAIVTWMTLYNLLRKRKHFIYKKILTYSFYFIIIFWCTFMGINSIEITGEITAYIICMFCFAACCVIKPLEAMSIYSTSSFIFVVGLVIYINDVKVLNSNIVNLLITMLLVGITSIMNYKSFSKDFLNKKHILQNKEELELTNQKLKEYENLRTDFFANISHELRTPLNVIYSAEQMLSILLQQKDFDSAKMNKYNKMIKQNTYRLLRLINNLIDITKIDASSFVVKLINIDIVKIVEDITMSVADYIEYKGISLIFDTEAEEKIVACDPDSIERIILNLLSNAVKFSPKNSSIFVSIFIETQNICISIKDTGIGISEEMQELIFDRFIQVDKLLKRAREGSGIGLALVKSLVEMHKGTISVKSKLNEGTEFIIRIPDKVISEDKDTSESYQIEEKCTNRVLIEFSDIYK